VVDESVVIAVIGSACLAVLGYVANGWRERSFQRKKTNYEAKLAQFSEISHWLSIMREALMHFEKWPPSADEREGGSAWFEVRQIVQGTLEISMLAMRDADSEELRAIKEEIHKNPDMETEHLSVYESRARIMCYGAIDAVLTNLRARVDLGRIVADTDEIRDAFGDVLKSTGDFTTAIAKCYDKAGTQVNEALLTSYEVSASIMHLAMNFELKVTLMTWVGLRLERRRFRVKINDLKEVSSLKRRVVALLSR